MATSLQGRERAAARRLLTETERNWFLAVALLLGSVGLFAAVYAVEFEAGRWNNALRLVREPAQAAMVYLGISHFLIALLYTATSRRMRSGRAWASFLGRLVLGGGLCAAYAVLLGPAPLLASALFVGYFLVHDFRDQVFFYFANGDAAAGPAGDRLVSLLTRTPLALLAGAVALIVSAAALGAPGTAVLQPLLAPLPPPLRLALGVVPPAMVAVAAAETARGWRRAGYRRIGEILRPHRPVAVVFLGTIAVLVAGHFLGWKAHSIVILHVAAWYVFTTRQLARRRSDPRPTGWRALRDTRWGFNVLHIGSAGLLVVAGVVWAYGFRNDAAIVPFAALLDIRNFPYWTILHVTASFGGR